MKNTLILSLLLLQAPLLQAHSQQTLEQVVVTASGTSRAITDIAQPAQVLDSTALQRQSGDTLGSLLGNIPGIANASFGPGVGRPVMRGMGGNRVRLLINGSDAADVSAMSSDHAGMAEAANASQIEVIHGPSTLLYGGGAIGGIVNVADQRIHQQAMHGIDGSASLRASSVDNGWQSKASMDAGAGQWVLHLDGFYRESHDYKANFQGRSSATIANSDGQSEGGNIALSWLPTDNAYLGVAVSLLDYEYAVPNEDNEPARVTPQQIRYELKTGINNISDWLQAWQLALSYTDYEHQERDDNTIEGLFEKQALELKTSFTYHIGDNWQGQAGLHYTHKALDLCHDHSGCNGIPDYGYLAWNGDKGSNFVSAGGFDFAHDTPMPLTETSDGGLFIVQSYFWQHGIVEFGLRADQRTISADPVSIRPASRQQHSYYNDKRFTPVSISTAATWAVAENHKLSLSLARAQRAPEAEELFWNGDHHATFSFQLDNPDLSNETAYTIDLGWTWYGTTQSRVNLFYYDFDGYIYNDRKAVSDPFHGDAVYRHEQRDARFAGIEASTSIPLDALLQQLYLDIFADYVNARLKQGSNRNLPRTPPASAGIVLHWQNDHWFAQLDTRLFAAQNNVADSESRTGSYFTLNAQAAWQRPLSEGQSLRIALKGNNLSNEAGFNHVSYLKDVAPVAGRNLILEATINF